MRIVDREHGIIERLDDGTHLVQVHGKPRLLELPGVYCENSRAKVENRIYSKLFKNKVIYLPDEGDKARSQVLSLDKKDVIILGMTGYSSITPADCAAWGIQEGAYEEACADIMANMIFSLLGEYPSLNLGVVEGASDMGVDKGVISAARKLKVPHLGYSCPNYMMYVVDDQDPVFVSRTKKEYSDSFVNDLTILCSVGGRLQALLHDIQAAIVLNKKLLLFDLIQTISANQGGPPARSADGTVQDATAAFLNAVKLFQPDGVLLSPYETLREWVQTAVVREARKLISAQMAFSGWQRRIPK